MPTYMYQCDECEVVFEVWQSIHDGPLVSHDETQESECAGLLTKVYQPPMFNKRQGQSEIVKTDDKGSHITKHWDGRQDAKVVAKPHKVKMTAQED